MALDLELLVMAYANGVFPMSDARDDPETFWIEPERRAIIPLDGLKLSGSLRKVIRQDRFTVTTDRAFPQVIAMCAESAADRRETWINAEIESAFTAMHAQGLAHSVECWRNGELVGGLYGLALGRAFSVRACLAGRRMRPRWRSPGWWRGFASADSGCSIASS